MRCNRLGLLKPMTVVLLSRSGAGRLPVAAPTLAKLDLARARGADLVVRMDGYDLDDYQVALRAVADRAVVKGVVVP
jgi:hypothetical protein